MFRIAQRQVELVRLPRIRRILDDDPQMVTVNGGASAAPFLDRQLDV
jgi:hypothetical protein